MTSFFGCLFCFKMSKLENNFSIGSEYIHEKTERKMDESVAAVCMISNFL